MLIRGTCYEVSYKRLISFMVKRGAGNLKILARLGRSVVENGRIAASGPAAELADDPRVREAYLGL